MDAEPIIKEIIDQFDSSVLLLEERIFIMTYFTSRVLARETYDLNDQEREKFLEKLARDMDLAIRMTWQVNKAKLCVKRNSDSNQS